MRNNIIAGIILLIIFYLIFSSHKPDYSKHNYYDKETTYNYYNENFDYTDGYNWAEENNIDDFSDCDSEYSAGTSAEDGYNKYVQENLYNNELYFGDYSCTEDCSGHEAGYNWAEEHDIDDFDNCGGNSQSFIEGCMEYVDENY